MTQERILHRVVRDVAFSFKCTIYLYLLHVWLMLFSNWISARQVVNTLIIGKYFVSNPLNLSDIIIE